MAFVEGLMERSLADTIHATKVLVVGAGGIGCEILKNLVLSGFADIEIIDLDTIDVSNLNRQFLFHKEHVGKSKANVARESALSFNPTVSIKAYHDSITTPDYGVSFFKRFGLVLNALDNRAARNHVNRMCLTADVPLIESGTAGYNGQVELIKKGLTQCYECTPKAAQKTYPGCTIRNTPSEPIHCIVWAKHLFNQLFGEHNADEDVSPDTADPEAAGDAGEDALSHAADAKGNVDRVSTRAWAQGCNYDPEKLFTKFFHDDIKYLLSMANLWKNRKAPNPAVWGEEDGDSAADSSVTGVLRDQKVWTLLECESVFKEAVESLRGGFAKLADGDHLVWDKDDRDAMDFVAACANIRAHVFGIEKKSRFEIKSMAGNIIPAIATTNAITAGISVLHAFKVLAGQLDKCASTYMRLRPNARNQLFVPEAGLTPPNPKCYVCAAKPEIVLKVDTNLVTVAELRDEILIRALNMINPDVTMESKGIIVISSDEDETEANNDKKLRELQIVDGCILKVDDFVQNYELTVTVLHIDAKRDEPRFEVVADPDVLKPKEEEEETAAAPEANDKPSTSNGQAATGPAPMEDSDDDLCVVEAPVEDGQPEDKKRKQANDEEGPSKKRVRRDEAEDDEDLIVID